MRAPPAFWVLIGIFIIVLLISFFNTPNMEDPQWWFSLVVIITLFIVAIVCLISLWPRRKPCDIYFYGKNYKICGNPSVGRISGNFLVHYYFCALHDPEGDWMRQWLAQVRRFIQPRTIYRFDPIDLDLNVPK